MEKVEAEGSTLSSDSIPNWLCELNLSDHEIESFELALERTEDSSSSSKLAFLRRFEVQDDKVTADIVDIDRAKGVFLRVAIAGTEVPESKGNEPSGYDPAKDYVTDTDYEAHHGD